MPVSPSEQSTLSAAAKRWLRPKYIVGTAFAIGPILAAVAPLGVAPLFGIVIVGLILHALLERQLPMFDRRAVAAAGAFLVWSTLSLIWTDAFPETLRFVPRAMLYVAGGMLFVAAARNLTDDERSFTDTCLLAGVAIGASLFAVEIVTDTGISTALNYILKGEVREFAPGALTRGAAFFAIFAFPAALAAYRRQAPLLAACLLAATVSLTFLVQGYKAALGTGIGFLFIGLSFVIGRRAISVLAAAIAVLIITAPAQSFLLRAIPGPWTTSDLPSVTHRVLIWDFVSERVAERPILGWGLNSSRAVPGGKEGPKEGTELLPLHPHNVPLQIWLELGFVGALIAAAGLAATTLGLRSVLNSHLEIGLTTATLGAAAAACAVGYGLWQGWWISTLWLALAAVAALVPRSPKPVR